MPELSDKSMRTLTEALHREQTARYHLDSGEWVASRIIENPELLKYLPPLLYALYRTWLQYCQDGDIRDQSEGTLVYHLLSEIVEIVDKETLVRGEDEVRHG